MSTEFRHTVNLIMGTGITALAAIIYASITARALGTELFGEVAVCLSIIMAAQTAFGPINGIVSRFTADYAAHNAWGMVRTLHRVFTKRVMIWGAVGVCALLPFTVPLRELFQLSSSSSLYLSYAILFATLCLSVGRGTLRGAQAFTAHNINTILEAVVRLIFGAILVYLWPSPGPALLAYLIAIFVTLAYTPRQLGTLWKNHRAQAFDGAAVRRFAWPMFGVMLITAGFQNIDMLYVKHEFSAEDAGIYGAAFTLTRLMAVLVTPFNVVLLPLLTAQHAGGLSIHGSLGRQCLYFLLLAAGPLALFFIWPHHVVRVFFSDAYGPASVLIAELALVRLLGHLCHMVALAGAAVGDFRFLYFYAPLFALQIVLLPWMGTDLQTVLHALLVVHVLMFVAFSVYIVVRLRAAISQ